MSKYSLIFKIQSAIASSFFLALLNQSVANASSIRVIPEKAAIGEAGAIPTIVIWTGSGVNISFIETGDTIQRVWLDDPSRLTVDFDSPLCSGSSQCETGGARVIHLRRISGVKFPQLPSTNKTLLTAIAINGDEIKRYQFEIIYGQGSPQYSGITISSERQINPPIATFNEPKILQGLEIARNRGLISRSQGNEAILWRVRIFLAFLNQNMSPTEASQSAGVSLALIEKLESMGQSPIFAARDSASPVTQGDLQKRSQALFCLKDADNSRLFQKNPFEIYTFLTTNKCVMPLRGNERQTVKNN